MNLIIGKVKTKSDNEINKKLEGLKLVLAKSGFEKDKHVILCGTDDESHNKLTEVLFETSGDWLGFDNLEEFRKGWKEGIIDGGFYIASKDIEFVKYIAEIKD